MECSVWYQAAKDPGKVERSSQEIQLGGGDVTKINLERSDSKSRGHAQDREIILWGRGGPFGLWGSRSSLLNN